jgi:hypothetical protein
MLLLRHFTTWTETMDASRIRWLATISRWAFIRPLDWKFHRTCIGLCFTQERALDFFLKKTITILLLRPQSNFGPNCVYLIWSLRKSVFIIDGQIERIRFDVYSFTNKSTKFTFGRKCDSCRGLNKLLFVLECQRSGGGTEISVTTVIWN